MKKVWILEEFNTPEDMAKSHDDMVKILEYAREEGSLTPDELGNMEKALIKDSQKMMDNPSGIWFGIAGRTIYKQFIPEAKRTIRSIKEVHPSRRFRVVEAQVENDAKYWLGYRNPQVNEGVLSYLMATV